MSNLMTASREWASRPADQRFLSLEELRAAVAKRKRESWTTISPTKRLAVQATEDDDLVVNVLDTSRDEVQTLEFTHWSFGQIAQAAGAPAAYLRKLPAPLAAVNLEWGLDSLSERDDQLVLARNNGRAELRALTSTTYGRIWDEQVVEAVQRVNDDGRWVVPSASYQGSDPRRATTLYASDRDVFIFLVDPSHPIEIPGQDKPSYRGFFTWNSEVGNATFGLATFLYEYVCDNRIIWGATDVQELRIRHTRGAPERFAYEGRNVLRRYSEESDAKLIAGIRKAQDTSIGKNAKEVSEWLAKRGFTSTVAAKAVERAVEEEGAAGTVWQAVQGLTAYARTIENTDARIELETKAGKLLADVAS